MNIDMQHPRKLKTGEFSIIRRVLPETIIDRLRATANQLKDIDSRPIYITNEMSLGKHTLERYANAGIKNILKHAGPLLKAMIGDEWLILANKALIRRTWPISETEACELGHNASNLTWHQDSNYKHGDNPMVVMMLSLQDGAGSTCPGLSILESPTNHFEGIFGYEGNKVKEFEDNVIKKQGQLKTAQPVINSGDLLVFNGLTFHRTFTNQNMNKHRDALLIRAVQPKHAKNFQKGPHLIIKAH